MLTELIATLRASAQRASEVFISRMIAGGAYSSVKEDLAVYYKHPMMYLSLRDYERAMASTNHIVMRYLRENGDFSSVEKGTPKSSNPAYQEFYAYTNGWIVRAANKLGREDITTPCLSHLTTLQDSKTGGFYTHDPNANDGITDVITTAHLGLVHLESGRLDVAIAAGDYLKETLNMQPKIEYKFYLRRDISGNCVTKFPNEAILFNLVNKSDPNQLYFMIAYPMAFLVELHKMTEESKYLETARGYADFAFGCHETVFSCEFSNKLAWALSKLYAFMPESMYLDAIRKITQYFISTQGEDSLWFSEDFLKCYDQSAEIVCWFMEISDNLESKDILTSIKES